MREILFRGKRVDNGKWVEGYYYHEIYRDGFNPNHPILWEKDFIRTKEPEGIFLAYEVISETVGQFSGREYLNLKLFEGDLLKRKNKTYEIVYDEYYCAFMLRCEELHRKYYFEHFDIFDFEFSGNIHDKKP